RAEEFAASGLTRIGPRGGAMIPALVALGQLEDARPEVDRSMQQLANPELLREFSPTALSTLLEAVVVLQDRAAAALLADRLADVVAVGNTPWGISPVARRTGAAAALLGEPELARERYARALAWAERIRHRPEIALTRLEIAELLLGDALSRRERGQTQAEAL